MENKKTSAKMCCSKGIAKIILVLFNVIFFVSTCLLFVIMSATALARCYTAMREIYLEREGGEGGGEGERERGGGGERERERERGDERERGRGRGREIKM